MSPWDGCAVSGCRSSIPFSTCVLIQKSVSFTIRSLGLDNVLPATDSFPESGEYLSF
jgi:hypothetical protein